MVIKPIHCLNKACFRNISHRTLKILKRRRNGKDFVMRLMKKVIKSFVRCQQEH